MVLWVNSCLCQGLCTSNFFVVIRKDPILEDNVRKCSRDDGKYCGRIPNVSLLSVLFSFFELFRPVVANWNFLSPLGKSSVASQGWESQFWCFSFLGLLRVESTWAGPFLKKKKFPTSPVGNIKLLPNKLGFPVLQGGRVCLVGKVPWAQPGPGSPRLSSPLPLPWEQTSLVLLTLGWPSRKFSGLTGVCQGSKKRWAKEHGKLEGMERATEKGKSKGSALKGAAHTGVAVEWSCPELCYSKCRPQTISIAC